jgi:putative transposase
MARLPRLVVAGQLHLLVQRSHGASPVFLNDDDFTLYRRALIALAGEHGVAIHAYALIPEQVLLLATPSSSLSFSRMLQALGRRFGADYNRRHARTGVLWEGRFRCTVVDADAHLLDCIRYVESAPVRAALATTAVDYPWSSAAHHVGRLTDAAVTDHPGYWALGNTPFEREARHGRLLDDALPAALQQRIADASVKGWALGDASYVAALTELTKRRVAPLLRGRPRAQGTSDG